MWMVDWEIHLKYDSFNLFFNVFFKFEGIRWKLGALNGEKTQ